MKVNLNVSEDGKVKRMMKAGRDFVTEEVYAHIVEGMLAMALSVEPSGRSDYPIMVIAHNGKVFYVDGTFKKEDSENEEVLED